MQFTYLLIILSCLISHSAALQPATNAQYEKYRTEVDRQKDAEKLYYRLLPEGWQEFDIDKNGKLSDGEELEMEARLGD